MILNVFALLVLAPLLCCAAESCPWINAGTVGGILGGAVDTKVTQTTCEFTRRGGSPSSTPGLEVEIVAQHDYPEYLSECKSKRQALKAIGNEAVTCNGGSSELAIGRVRDRVFVIRVSSKNHSAAQNNLAAEAREAAEHVAGNLF